MTLDPDGAIWFTRTTANQVARIDTAGKITEFAVPTPKSFPRHITPGPDGAVWFTEFNTNQARSYRRRTHLRRRSRRW